MFIYNWLIGNTNIYISGSIGLMYLTQLEKWLVHEITYVANRNHMLGGILYRHMVKPYSRREFYYYIAIPFSQQNLIHQGVIWLFYSM